MAHRPSLDSLASRETYGARSGGATAQQQRSRSKEHVFHEKQLERQRDAAWEEVEQITKQLEQADSKSDLLQQQLKALEEKLHEVEEENRGLKLKVADKHVFEQKKVEELKAREAQLQLERAKLEEEKREVEVRAEELELHQKEILRDRDLKFLQVYLEVWRSLLPQLEEGQEGAAAREEKEKMARHPRPSAVKDEGPAPPPAGPGPADQAAGEGPEPGSLVRPRQQRTIRAKDRRSTFQNLNQNAALLHFVNHWGNDAKDHAERIRLLNLSLDQEVKKSELLEQKLKEKRDTCEKLEGRCKELEELHRLREKDKKRLIETYEHQLHELGAGFHQSLQKSTTLAEELMGAVMDHESSEHHPTSPGKEWPPPAHVDEELEKVRQELAQQIAMLEEKEEILQEYQGALLSVQEESQHLGSVVEHLRGALHGEQEALLKAKGQQQADLDSHRREAEEQMDRERHDALEVQQRQLDRLRREGEEQQQLQLDGLRREELALRQELHAEIELARCEADELAAAQALALADARSYQGSEEPRAVEERELAQASLLRAERFHQERLGASEASLAESRLEVSRQQQLLEELHAEVGRAVSEAGELAAARTIALADARRDQGAEERRAVEERELAQASLLRAEAFHQERLGASEASLAESRLEVSRQQQLLEELQRQLAAAMAARQLAGEAHVEERRELLQELRSAEELLATTKRRNEVARQLAEEAGVEKQQQLRQELQRAEARLASADREIQRPRQELLAKSAEIEELRQRLRHEELVAGRHVERRLASDREAQRLKERAADAEERERKARYKSDEELVRSLRALRLLDASTFT